MKKIFKKIARFFVLLYARRQYNKAIMIADVEHDKKKKTFYVTLAPYNNHRLIIIDRKTFRKIKRDLKIYDKRQGMIYLKDGCFYHTPDANETKQLSKQNIEIRKIAFYNLILGNAGLLTI